MVPAVCQLLSQTLRLQTASSRRHLQQASDTQQPPQAAGMAEPSPHHGERPVPSALVSSLPGQTTMGESQAQATGAQPGRSLLSDLEVEAVAADAEACLLELQVQQLFHLSMYIKLPGTDGPVSVCAASQLPGCKQLQQEGSCTLVCQDCILCCACQHKHTQLRFASPIVTKHLHTEHELLNTNVQVSFKGSTSRFESGLSVHVSLNPETVELTGDRQHLQVLTCDCVHASNVQHAEAASTAGALHMTAQS